MLEMAPTHENQWNNIQFFNCLSAILCGQLWSHSVADLVTAMYNTIPTETAVAHEEERKVSKVVEGAATKSEYLDGIGFLNGKGDHMTEFTKAVKKRMENIMYLKVLCKLYGPAIDYRILLEPFESQFWLKLLQSKRFSNGDIRPLSGSPGKVKSKKKATGSYMAILQDNDYD